MCGASRLENNLMDIAPSFDVFKFFRLREDELLAKSDLSGFLIQCQETLGHDSCSVEDSSESGTKQVSLFAAKGRVGVDLSVQVSTEYMLDLSSLSDMNRSAVWQLDPVIEQVIRNPEDSFVNSFTAGFNFGILRVLLSF